LTPEASAGILDFLAEYDKSATLSKIQAFLEEEYNLLASISAISVDLRRQKIIKKKVYRFTGDL
jgi:hypothetical protein